MNNASLIMYFNKKYQREVPTKLLKFSYALGKAELTILSQTQSKILRLTRFI